MKTVLISGGTRGIGKACVLRLLDEKYNVAAFSQSSDSCRELEKELEKEYEKKNYLVLQGDVTREVDMKRLVDNAVKKFGTIDILINNAGCGYFPEADKVDIKKFQRMLDINLKGVAVLTKLVVPVMKKKGAGTIINIASISGKTAYAQGEFYSATKFGIMGFSEGLRNELREHGIKVATVCPGMVETEFFGDEELKRRKKDWGGIPRMLEPDNVGLVVSLICSQPEHVDIRDLTIMPFDL